jgi:hypothetical protein
MSHVDCTDFVTEIGASAETVFATMKDVQAWSSWTRAIKKAWVRSEGPWRQGYKFVMRTMVTSVPIPVTVLELEENRLIGWGAKNPLLTVIHRISFEPLGPNRCRVRNHEFVEGLFGNAVGRLVAAPIDRLDRQWAADLAAHFRAQSRSVPVTN